MVIHNYNSYFLKCIFCFIFSLLFVVKTNAQSELVSNNHFKLYEFDSININQVNQSSISIDTAEFSKMLKLFYKNPTLFNETNSYFFVSDESISNNISQLEYDKIFIQNHEDSIKSFIDQHSSENSYTILDFENILNATSEITLKSGNKVFLRKDSESIMITDRKHFESVIKGHMVINKRSIFFIQLLLR